MMKTISLLLLIIGIHQTGRVEAAVEASKVPKIVDQVERINHPEGTNATFTCTIGSGELNGLKFSWLRDEKTVSTSSRHRISVAPENFNSILRVIDLRPDDAGVYSCVARNTFGQDKISIKLLVKVELKWVEQPKEEISVSLGRPLQVACAASGQPAPRIDWSRLDATGQTSLGSELKFSSVDLSDAGLYECRASNGMENDLVTRFKLNVMDIIDEVLDNAREDCEAQQGSNRLHFVVPKLVRTTGTKLSTLTTVRYLKTSSSAGETFEEAKCNIKLSEFFDGQTVFDFLNKELASWRQTSQLRQLERFYNRLGRVCNQLFVFLKTQQHLLAALDRVRTSPANSWHFKSAAKLIGEHLNRFYPDQSHPRRLLVLRVLSEHETRTSGELMRLPEFLIHSDLGTKNLLIDARNSKEPADKRQLCIIDFQDIQTGPQVVELSAMMLYCVIEQDHMPFETALSLLPRFLLAGYQSDTSWPLASQQEMQLIPSLMKLRLCQSLLNGQFAHERDPANTYVLQTNQRGWQLLEAMCNELSNETLVSSWRLAE